MEKNLKQILINETQKHIRPLDLSKDLKEVADIIETCFDNYLDDDGYRFLRHLRSIAANRSLQSKAQLFLRIPMQGFVWEENGRIIGNLNLMYVRATMQEKIISFPKSGYLIANVATYPEFEGRGIAKALTQHALNYLKSKNVQNAYLQVRENNPAAIHIYKSFGFQEFARRSTWFKIPQRNNFQLSETNEYEIEKPKRKDWQSIKDMFQKNYPRKVQWHLPIQLSLIRTDFLGYLNRSFYDIDFKQWTLYKKNNVHSVLGSVVWQTSKNMTNYIWVASDQENDDVVLKNLVPYLENDINRKKITFDFPINRGKDILPKLGFSHKQNLIWMNWSSYH
jgi:ribosomal protein S18 acetylase RimI-like enzyme